MKVKNLSIFVLICLFSACATSRKIDLADIAPTDGVAIGEVKVFFNGALKKGCSIQFEDMSQKRHGFKLDDTGNVALILPQGKNIFRKIICSDVGPYTYMFSNNTFINAGDGMITYFGKIEIDWKVDGGFKTSLLFGAVGAALDAGKDSSEGSAVMKVQTREPASSVVRDFVKLNGKIKKSKFKKSLLEIGTEKDANVF